jgi:hypothetical protein
MHTGISCLFSAESNGDTTPQKGFEYSRRQRGSLANADANGCPAESSAEYQAEDGASACPEGSADFFHRPDAVDRLAAVHLRDGRAATVDERLAPLTDESQ